MLETFIRNTTVNVVSKFFQIVKKTGKDYGLILSGSTYCPWNTNEPFLKIYNAIKKYTVVHQYRCYELWCLVEQCSKLNEGSIIQIGVWRGGSGALIAKQAENCGIKNPVYLCDTFTGVVKAGEKDATYKGGEFSNTSPEMVNDLCKNITKVNNVRILKGIFPEETAREVECEKFRFCHIDVDVYDSAKGIIDWIWAKMVPGGIVVFDDYGSRSCNGITQYVHELKMSKDRILLHNLNGNAVMIKLY